MIPMVHQGIAFVPHLLKETGHIMLVDLILTPRLALEPPLHFL